MFFLVSGLFYVIDLVVQRKMSSQNDEFVTYGLLEDLLKGKENEKLCALRVSKCLACICAQTLRSSFAMKTHVWNFFLQLKNSSEYEDEARHKENIKIA